MKAFIKTFLISLAAILIVLHIDTVVSVLITVGGYLVVGLAGIIGFVLLVAFLIAGLASGLLRTLFSGFKR